MSILTAFFGNAKLVLGSVVTFVAAIFLFVFKARGREIEEQQEEIKELKREEEVNSKIKETSEEIEDIYNGKEKEIEETYNEKEGFVYKTTNKPLAPTLLSKLRSVQGLQNNSDESSQ